MGIEKDRSSGKRTLLDAHMPTWIKATIWEIRNGNFKGGYRALGYRIGSGSGIYDLCDHLEERFTDEEWKHLASWDGYEERYFLREGVDATAILKRILASERHPNGDGDLLVQIPVRHRGEFLCGLIHGVAEA